MRAWLGRADGQMSATFVTLNIKHRFGGPLTKDVLGLGTATYFSECRPPVHEALLMEQGAQEMPCSPKQG